MSIQNHRVVSILVKNNYGVLSRISGLFCRRGFNIDSVTSSATTDPNETRITITVHDNDAVLKQVILQTARMEDTIEVYPLDNENSLQRELLLIKIEATAANRSELREIATIFKAKIIDLSPCSMVMELTGQPKKVDAFLKMTEGYNVLEMARTGITAMERGGKHVHNRKPQEHCQPEVFLGE